MRGWGWPVKNIALIGKMRQLGQRHVTSIQKFDELDIPLG